MDAIKQQQDLLWHDNWDTEFFPVVMRKIAEGMIATRYTGMDGGIEDACRFMFFEGWAAAELDAELRAEDEAAGVS